MRTKDTELGPLSLLLSPALPNACAPSFQSSQTIKKNGAPKSPSLSMISDHPLEFSSFYWPLSQTCGMPITGQNRRQVLSESIRNGGETGRYHLFGRHPKFWLIPRKKPRKSGGFQTLLMPLNSSGDIRAAVITSAMKSSHMRRLRQWGDASSISRAANRLTVLRLPSGQSILTGVLASSRMARRSLFCSSAFHSPLRAAFFTGLPQRRQHNPAPAA